MTEMKRPLLWRAAAVFFAGMVVFTLLSRAAYQSGTALIYTAKPSAGLLTHGVRTTGRTGALREQAVSVLPGLRVQSVEAGEGQRVGEGDILFTLDLAYLQEQLDYQNEELEKQNLSTRDAQSRASVSHKQHSLAQAQAAASYDAAVTSAWEAVDAAGMDLDAAEQDLNDYYVWADENGDFDLDLEQELQAALASAQAAYDRSLANAEAAEQSAALALQAANLPEASDSSPKIGAISAAQLERERDKLQALLEAEGRITAPVDGVVTRLSVRTGEKTGDGAAVVLAEMSQGSRFQGTVTTEQAKYIGVGDLVSLTDLATGKIYKDLPVTAMSSTEGGGYQVTVTVPPDTLGLGAAAELSFTRKSSPYDCTVPLGALRLDGRNQPYVLVPEESSSIMGTELRAVKIPVTVLERGDRDAALAPGSLSRDQRVILGSDKPVDAGSRVRMEAGG